LERGRLARILDAMTEHKGWHSRGYLPHLDSPGTVQAVTFRLHDSLPAEILKRLEAEKDPAKRRAAYDEAMDAGQGSCLLRHPDAAAIVEDCLLHRDGIDYRLIAWVVMPNHVHAVLEPVIRLPDIVKAWKSVTAKRINAWRAEGGRVWQPEYFDRFIRDDGHLVTVVQYVENNPVKAGLCETPEQWRFGTAAKNAGEGARAPEKELVRTCPICGRDLIPGPSVDEHHWVPKSEGGRVTSAIHKICHRQLHARFTEKELATHYSTPDAVRSDAEMARFIRWVAKRPAEYLDWPKDWKGR
jgi:REP element-mobilizing transposase RayT